MEYAVLTLSKVISSSESFRLDAAFFQREALIKKVSQKNPVQLKKITSWITQGPNPRFSDSGIPCLTGRNIADGELTFEGSDLIDDSEFNELKKFTLKRNDILITLKGAGSTGKVALFQEGKKAIFSRNLGIIRLSHNSYPAIVAFIFLASKIGQKLIDRGVTGGTGQLTLPTTYLKNLNIPRFSESFNELVEKITIESLQLKDNSLAAYSLAEKILLSDLNILNWEPKHHLSFVKKYSDTNTSGRIDAEYFQPKYEEIIEAVKKYKNGFVKLHEVAKTRRGSLISDVFYSEDGSVPYIRGADFSSGFLVGDKLTYINNSFKPNNETKVKKGNIVFTLIGSVGATALVDAMFDGAFISNNVGKISTKDYNPTVLQILLHSVIGKMYFQKEQTQTAQPKISDKDIHGFILPTLKSDVITKIENRYIKSQDTKALSKRLLDIAKRGVEMAIEKSEKDAQSWINSELKKLNIH